MNPGDLESGCHKQEGATHELYYRLCCRAPSDVVALLAIVIFLPLFVVVSVLVLFDLGAPVVFWQKRIGRNGKSFL